MDQFKLAADSNTSMLLSARTDALHKVAQTIASFGRSWCPIEPLEKISVDVPETITRGSEEHHQLSRAVVRADDIASAITQRIDSIRSELDLSQLVNLYWSLAILGRFEEQAILTIQKRISEMAPKGLDTNETCKLLFSESTFFHRNSAINPTFDEETFASFPLGVQANVLQSLALMRKDIDMVFKLKKIVLSNTVRMIKSNTEFDRDVVPFFARLCLFIGALTGQDSHHDVSRLKGSLAVNRLPAWKYAFELCLATHAVASKGIELNPFVENVFATDVLYLPQKGRKKLIVELVRPSSIVWSFEADDVSVFGIDAYTRLTRLTLAYLGYRVITITLAEWLKQKGDKSRQISYVKRRIRNCLRHRRLFSGTERDELRSESDDGNDSSDSDMSS